MTVSTDNPLLTPWTTRFGLPPFGEIKPEHFGPAFEQAMAEQKARFEAIATNPEAPSVANTLEALETAGELMGKVGRVFWNLTGSDATPELQAIEREVAPKLARFHAELMTDARLFARVKALYDRRDALDLTAEQRRLLDCTFRWFSRSGGGLEAPARERLKEIAEQLSQLGTKFSQNILADESAYALILDGEDDLAGCPDFLKAAMARAASDRGHDGKHAVTLSRSIIEPFLTFSARRDLREIAFKAWIARGENGGATDNRGIIADIVKLRAERAHLLGFDCFADFKLDDSMAKTPAAVRNLLETVWAPARAKAECEGEALQALVDAEGRNHPLEAWDWRYYAEKERHRLHDFDEAELKPYFSLEAMIEAAFDTANRLFGISFERFAGLAGYHPDVRIYEVKDRAGRHLALFLGDYFARPTKRSGAWMSAFRGQQKLARDERPIIVNVMNFAKPAEGQPTLLSFDDVRTLFHEFGHALHGMLSNVTYPSLAGTAVARDFVELPSQLYEHWVARPEVLSRHARHVETGAPIPAPLIDKLLAARNFNQGFQTVEYTASALVDLEFHSNGMPDPLDVDRFEADELNGIGMPRNIVMRHRPAHFAHVFSGDGYSSGYYSYLWSEVLDADAFQAFTETGDVFDPKTAARLHDFIYSAGNSRDPEEAYLLFRGRLPSVEGLLEKRGLIA